ncbi:LysE family translocator [Actinomadura barringtoniae]|uniref:LysE family translocator n=1 Tax=Actinomadura barringtoniae TaxID=1427535 RepID=A0A939PR63_9ACTN|nr:LysE family translocator [Actinomadura barringtoniae]MBO2454743.1 LysE family translocator [Actinomadura barringtoniae]
MLQSLIAFVGAAFLIAMAPGPSTVVIMRQSMRSGRRAGLVTTLGNETGVLVWGVAAAVGLSALLAASQIAYDALRIIGAAVLVYFGAKALWQARKRGADQTETGAGASADAATEEVRADWSPWRCFRLGLVTNFANPKAGVFAVSFLPQFVPQGAPVLWMLLAFSAMWALIDLVWYTGVVWLVSAARRLMNRPTVRRRLDQVSGVVLVGLGLRLAAEAR